MHIPTIRPKIIESLRFLKLILCIRLLITGNRFEMSLNLVCIRLNACRWLLRWSRVSIAMEICSLTNRSELQTNTNNYKQSLGACVCVLGLTCVNEYFLLNIDRACWHLPAGTVRDGCYVADLPVPFELRAGCSFCGSLSIGQLKYLCVCGSCAAWQLPKLVARPYFR